MSHVFLLPMHCRYSIICIIFGGAYILQLIICLWTIVVLSLSSCVGLVVTGTGGNSVVLGLVLSYSIAAKSSKQFDWKHLWIHWIWIHWHLFPKTPFLFHRTDLVSLINVTTTREEAAQYVIQFPLEVDPSLVYVPTLNTTTSGRLVFYMALLIVRAVSCCLSWLGAIWIMDYDRLKGWSVTLMHVLYLILLLWWVMMMFVIKETLVILERLERQVLKVIGYHMDRRIPYQFC